MLGPKPPTNRSPEEREDANEFNYSFTVKLRLGVGFVVGYLAYNNGNKGENYFPHSSPPKNTDHNLLLSLISIRINHLISALLC